MPRSSFSYLRLQPDSIVRPFRAAWISRPADGKCRKTQVVGARFGMDRKKRVRCTIGEIGKIKVVKDFLPPPDRLVLREANVKVTLSLSRRSVDFFKREAARQRVPYQRMIRALVDAYAEREK